MIRTRKWIMSNVLPRKYGKMTAFLPTPPPVEPMRPYRGRQDHQGAANDPLGEAIENFERALRERKY
jgi:hypothetical protein